MPENTLPENTGTSSWIVPITGLVIGVAYLVIGLVRDDVAGGVTGLLIMVAYCGGLLLFRRRAEAVALLNADATDERQATILVNALAATGQVLILLIVGGVFWSLITDQYVGVFTLLAAAGGATFIASTVWFTRRG